MREDNENLRFQLDNRARFIDELKREQEEREAALLNETHRK